MSGYGHSLLRDSKELIRDLNFQPLPKTLEVSAWVFITRSSFEMGGN